MTDNKFNGSNDQLINQGIRLRVDVKDRLYLIPIGFLLMFWVAFPSVVNYFKNGAGEPSLAVILAPIVLAVWLTVTAWYVSKPMKQLLAFKRTEPEAYKRAQQIMTGVPFLSYLNKNSEIYQRTYGSN